MRDTGATIRPALRITDDLQGDAVVATVYWSETVGYALLRLNRSLLTGQDFDRVLSWARREIARGARVSWLLADELAELA